MKDSSFPTRNTALCGKMLRANRVLNIQSLRDTPDLTFFSSYYLHLGPVYNIPNFEGFR